MSGHRLVLLGGETPRAALAWVRLRSSGEVEDHGVVGEGGSVPAAAPSRTVLVLPGADATVRRVELDGATEVQARAALPHLFQGALAATGQELHFAVGADLDGDGRVLAAAMDRARLADWMARCAALGADPRAIFLDFTVLPASKGEVEIIETPRLTIVAGGPFGGFSIEPTLAPQLLSRWLQQIPETVSAVHLAGGDPAAWAGRLGPVAPALRARPMGDPILDLARAAADAPAYAPNLRQGDFAPASAKRSSPRLWGLAAVLAVIAVVLQMGSLALQGVRMEAEAKATMAKAEADFRAARPDVKRIDDLGARVRSIVNAAGNTANHPVLAVAVPLRAALQANPEVRLDELRHDPPGREIVVRLSATRSEALAAIGPALEAKGLKVRQSTVRTEAGRASAQFTLERP